jgi:hypothetical protein
LLSLANYKVSVRRPLITASVTACLTWGAVALTAVSAAAAGQAAAYTFVSAPNLHPPRLQVLTRRAGLAMGDFLVATSGPPTNSTGQSGPMILDSHADPIWFDHSNGVLVFEQERYHGKPVLVWSEGRGVKLVNEHYRRVATVDPHAPWTFDGHDAAIIGNDVWLTVIRMVSGQNLAPNGGPADGSVIDCGLQEYDLGTGHLLRTWDVLNPRGRPNVPLSDSEVSANSSGGSGPHGGPRAWDAYHLNSVQALPDGNLLVSMRNTWAVYLVDPASGSIIWTLGGRHSSFKIGSGASFSWQHDARLLDPAQGGRGPSLGLTLFDDNNGGFSGAPSAGMVLSLSTIDRTATLVDAYRHDPPLSAGILGSMQLLPNEDALVGWGSEPYLSEYSKSGRELFDARWPGGDRSYRALFTDSWVGSPYYPPRGAVRGSTVYASWNGATQVARWEVLAGSSSGRRRSVASHRRTGFETAIKVGSSHGSYEVRALSASGRVLGTSKTFS